MLEQHLQMLAAAIDSPVMIDGDRRELLLLLLGQCGDGTFDDYFIEFGRVISRFHHQYPALYSDCVREWFMAHADEDVETLLRQLDDPEVSNHSVAYSFVHLMDRLRNDAISLLTLGLILPVVIHLRKEAIVEGLNKSRRDTILAMVHALSADD